MSGIHHVTAIAGNRIAQSRLLHPRARPAPRQEDRQFRRSRHLSLLLRRRGRPARHDPDLLPVGAARGPGRVGVGETQETAFRVPARSIGYWTHRFIEKGIAHEALEKRFGEPVLPFTDPDGMSLALVGVPGAENEPGWSNGDVPAEHAIRGFHGVTLLLDKAAKTGAILTDVFGFTEIGARRLDHPLQGAGDADGGIVDIYEAGASCRAGRARGSVHHIAFRAADDAEQAAMAQQAGREPRPAADRAEGPQLFPLGLLPRARRRAVRDRHRHPRLRRRRAGRNRSAST